MTVRALIILILLPLAAGAMAAPRVSAEDFHARASALKAKGPLALLEKDAIDTLVAQATASGEAARKRRADALKAGRRAPYCPPGDKVDIGGMEFLDRLSAIPQAERRRMSLDTATLRILAARYPCPR